MLKEGKHKFSKGWIKGECYCMIDINDKAKCCGCAACEAVCPKHCISMQSDEEGFLYPYVEKKSCIHCDMCDRACPITNKIEKVSFVQKGYLIRHKDKEIRLDSTSGGAFTAFAETIIDRGGYVVGAALDEQLKVKHIVVGTKKNLGRFRNSKYVQSNLQGIYSSVKKLLDDNKIVCFSGTPCQIEGLRSYLKKDYKSLYCIDTVCRAVPSPGAFEKYKEYQENTFNDELVGVRFRDKYYGYSYSTLNVKLRTKDSKYHRGIESDPWLRAFFSEMCDRPSCHQCVFRSQYRCSDITMWDCFNVHDFFQKWDDGTGVTRILVHTAKGQELLDESKKYAETVDVSVNELVKDVKEMVDSPIPNKRRSEFMRDLEMMDGKALFDKYFPIRDKNNFKHLMRVFLAKTGIYNNVKYGLRKVKKKGKNK